MDWLGLPRKNVLAYTLPGFATSQQTKSNAWLLIKALVTVEGVARALCPDVDIVAEAGPYATRLVAAQMLEPSRLARRVPAAIEAAIAELTR